MPAIMLESLFGETLHEYIDRAEWPSKERECLITRRVEVAHDDGTVEEVSRLYGFHRHSGGLGSDGQPRGPRVYRELSPAATLAVLRGQACASHWAVPSAHQPCNGRPTLAAPSVPQPPRGAQ